MKRTSRANVLILAALALVLACATTAWAGKPAPPPPVKYRLTWLEAPGFSNTEARDINNRGEVLVTAYQDGELPQPHLYTPGQGMCNLRDLPGWDATYVAGSSASINENGQIVGSAYDTTGAARGFWFDPAAQRFVVLPAIPEGYPRPRWLNDASDIVARSRNVDQTPLTVLYKWDTNSPPQPYVAARWTTSNDVMRINNLGQILTYGNQRYTPGTGWQTFSFAANSWGMNHLGTFVGRCVSSNKPPKHGAFRFTDPDKLLRLLDSSSIAMAADVNLQGDLCGRYGRRAAFLYTDRDGLWLLDDLVVTQDQTWLSFSIIDLIGINDRPAPPAGFGQICGNGELIDASGAGTWYAFLLTPEP